MPPYGDNPHGLMAFVRLANEMTLEKARCRERLPQKDVITIWDRESIA